MRYIFENFEFDSTNLVLTKNGKVLALRHNEVKLLVFLLEQSGNVLSKEDILTHVWQGKIVSEQAVFQNISHLRNIFGVGAIKTFSKRGYRWELSVKAVNEISSGGDKKSHPSHQSIQVKNFSKLSWALLLILTSIVIFLLVLNIKENTQKINSDSVIKLAYLPFNNLQNEREIHFKDNSVFDFTQINDLDTISFGNSIELVYPTLKEEHPFVLTGSYRLYQQTIYLDFTVKGPFEEWSGVENCQVRHLKAFQKNYKNT